MNELKWLPEAVEDIDRLHTFLTGKDPEAARREAKCILNAADQLKSSPRIGRPMPDETGRREFFSTFGAGAYVLRYILEDDHTAVIIRVYHSREDR